MLGEPLGARALFDKQIDCMSRMTAKLRRSSMPTICFTIPLRNRSAPPHRGSRRLHRDHAAACGNRQGSGT